MRRIFALAFLLPLAGCPQFQAGEAAVQSQAPALLASPTQIIAQQLILETQALQQLKAVLDGQQPPTSPLGSAPAPVKPAPTPKPSPTPTSPISTPPAPIPAPKPVPVVP